MEASDERESNIEVICETRHVDTDVRWFIGTEEVKAGDRNSTKQFGYSKRLLIKDFQPTDEDFTAVVGSEKVSIYIDVTSKFVVQTRFDTRNEMVQMLQV